MRSSRFSTRVGPDSIHEVIDGYAAVRDNLLRVSPDYPKTEYFHGLVAQGPVKYGMTGFGADWDSTGSTLLIKAVDRADDRVRPLNVALWVGANCLAQVCSAGEGQVSAAESSSCRLYGESDTTGKHFRPHETRPSNAEHHNRTQEELSAFISKVRVYPISDQVRTSSLCDAQRVGLTAHTCF